MRPAVDGFFYGHLSWHLSLCEIQAGNWEEALRTYRDAIALDRRSGRPCIAEKIRTPRIEMPQRIEAVTLKPQHRDRPDHLRIGECSALMGTLQRGRALIRARRC